MGMSRREFLQFMRDQPLLIVRRVDCANHQVDGALDVDIAQGLTGGIPQISGFSGDALPAPLRHHTAVQTRILKVRLKIGDDRMRVGASAQILNSLAMPQECRNADAYRFDATGNIFYAGSVWHEAVGLREQQHSFGRHDDRLIEAMIFMAQSENLRTELQPNAGQVSWRDLILADDKGFQVTRSINAMFR
ncbi:hypothetical protein AB8A05_15440 [Tardiphaga sp. 538_B7_N1_4]|uniref:hypothetical protein n=1 Tax=Tardiphaga sp. 538_B7_N1_4 TaxID=3240778 RepID=UPI003F21F971